MPLTLFFPSMSLHLVLVLAHFLWQGLLLGVLAMLAAWLLRRAPAQSRYAVYLSALVLMVLCLPVTSFVLTRGRTASNSSSPTATVTEPVPYVPDGFMALPEYHPLGEVLPEQRPVPLVYGWRALAPVLTFLYLLGVVGMLARFAWGLAAGYRMRRDREPLSEPAMLEIVARRARALGLRFVPAVAYCQRIAVPALVGVLRPMILLPVALASTLTPEEIEAILTHELAHLRRYDPLVNFVQRIIEAVLFFHPCVWYLSRQVSREREHCCDDLVLASGATPRAYAQSLLRIAELSLRASRATRPRWSSVLQASGDRPSQLRGRIIRLLGDVEDSRVRLSRTGLWTFAAMLLVGVALALGAVRSAAVAQPEEKPTEATSPSAEQAVPRDQRLVRITATDAKTGLPIPSLTILAGEEELLRPITWDYSNRKQTTDRPAEFRLVRPWKSTVLRIAAEGYQPLVTQPIARRGEVLTLAVQLEPDPGITGTVLTPDGAPAQGATLALCTYIKAVIVGEGKLQYYSMYGPELVPSTAAADGSFRLPSEVDPWLLVIAHDRGYAELTPEEVSQSSTVTLKAWGRLEGEMAPQGKPLAEEVIGVRETTRDDDVGQLSPTANRSYHARATTDSQGKFVFEKMPPITVEMSHQPQHPSLKSAKSTYIWCSSHVSIVPGETTRVRLPAPGRSVTGRMALPSESRLRIVDLSWEASAILRPPTVSGFGEEVQERWNAYHLFLESELGQAYRRDPVAIHADGTFRIEGLPAGNYLLRVTARQKSASSPTDGPQQAGFLARRFEVPPLGESSEPLNLGELTLRDATPPETPAVQETSGPTKTVSGQVVDEQGQPLSGVRLWLRTKVDIEAYCKHQPPRFTLEGRSDAQGRFEFQVPEAWMKATATPLVQPVFASLWAYAEGRQVMRAEDLPPLLLHEERPVHVQLVMTPGEETTLTVQDPQGKPLVGATVTPRVFRNTPLGGDELPEALSELLRAQTDAQGRMTLRGGSNANWASFEINGPWGQQTLHRAAFARQVPSTITVRRAGRVQGRVTAENPAWVRGLVFFLLTSAGVPEHDALRGEALVTTDERGGFVVPTLAEGPLDIHFLPVDKNLPVRPQMPQKIQVQAGATTELEIPLVPATLTTGVVRAHGTGTPIAGTVLNLQLLRPDNFDDISSTIVQTDPEGKFAARLLPGIYRVQTSLRPKPYTTRDRVQITVPNQATPYAWPPIEFWLSEPVPGRLVDELDRPIAAAEVSAYRPESEVSASATSAEDGQFTLQGLPKGENLRQLQYLVRFVNSEKAQTAVVVGENPLVLRMPGRLILEGTVIDPEGKPVAGASVEPCSPLLSLSHSGRPAERVQTDRDGHFRVTGYPAHYPQGVIAMDSANQLAGAAQIHDDSRSGEVAPLTVTLSVSTTGLFGQIWVDGKRGMGPKLLIASGGRRPPRLPPGPGIPRVDD